MIPVVQCDANMVEIAKFDSISDAGEKLCLDSANIGSVCKGKRISSGGFRWKYG